MGSHHGRNHSLQRLVLPHGGLDTAQPTDTGGDKPRNSEVPGAMGSGGRFQHGATFGQYATHARTAQGFWSSQQHPTFRHGASVRCFDYFVAHRAVACKIREVRVLEDSGISPHHSVQMKLKRSFRGLVTRVQATPECCHQPIVGCAREPRCWDFDQSASMDERWTQLMQSTEQEILGGMWCPGRRGASSHGQRGRTSMGDQESCTCEVSQQAQHGQRHKVVESVEQQIARALTDDGSPAHQTTTPPATAGAD